jgi:hypothetical protein
MNLLNIVKENQEEFKDIAEKIFTEYAIKTHDSLFRMIELEFYWNSSSHADNSTYLRKYVDPKSGEWFFHYSGVDIALRNEKTGGYGGILIRSIIDINSKEIFKGPQVCVMRLFSGSNAFGEFIQTKIVEHKFDNNPMIISKPRKGLGDNAKKNGADKFSYGFTINPILI